MTANNRSDIRILGVLSAIASAVLLVVYFMNRGMAAQGGHDLGISIWVAAYLLAVSVPILMGSRIASLLFSVPCALVGLWLCVGSVLKVPMPWALLNILFALVAFIPLYVSVRSFSSRNKMSA